MRNLWRRRAQNRAAQRAFRTRQVDKGRENATVIEELSSRVQHLENENDMLVAELQSTRQQVSRLETERRATSEDSTMSDKTPPRRPPGIPSAGHTKNCNKKIDAAAVANGLF